MSIDRPVASVTGRDEWEWNHWQAAVQSAQGSTDGADSRRPERWGRDAGDVAELRRRVHALERELERRDRRLQDVIDHYERLLEEKNRKIAAQRSGSDEASWTASVASRVRR
ncbi:MAG: hypothetical protein ACOCS7_00235 [Halolamina sp.]